MNTHQTGSTAEDAAVRYLKEQGYQILERNYRFHHTEIDIIAKEKNYLVFIEVKYRRTAAAQHPLAAVGQEKKKRISVTALHYLQQHHAGLDVPCRFDVVGIQKDEIRHIRNAFEYIPPGKHLPRSW